MISAFPVSFLWEPLLRFPCFSSRNVALGLRLGSASLEAEPEMGCRVPACVLVRKFVSQKKAAKCEGREEAKPGHGIGRDPASAEDRGALGCHLHQNLPSREARNLGFCTVPPSSHGMSQSDRKAPPAGVASVT